MFAILNGLVPLPGVVEVTAFAFVLVAEVGVVSTHQDDGVNFIENKLCSSWLETSKWCWLGYLK